jgi:hypothetical protein
MVIAVDAPERLPCGGLLVEHVGFERWDEAAKMMVEVVVHWSLAFVYLRAHPEAQVSKVYWRDSNGFGAGRGEWSFAKWFQWTGTGKYWIGAGAYGDSHVLVER